MSGGDPPHAPSVIASTQTLDISATLVSGRGVVKDDLFAEPEAEPARHVSEVFRGDDAQFAPGDQIDEAEYQGGDDEPGGRRDRQPRLAEPHRDADREHERKA